MLSFLIGFILVLLLSSIAINGFFNITRGKWVTQPDGTQVFQGKIFKFWLKFLQRHTVTRVYYQGEEWMKEFARMAVFLNETEVLAVVDDGVIVNRMDERREKYFMAFMAVNNLKFTSRPSGTGNPNGFRDNSGWKISVYREDHKYKLPFWVREPLGDCITCMASAGGTLCWLFWYHIIQQLQHLYPSTAGAMFLEMPIISKIGLWIMFCFSLAWANEIIFYSNYKLKS